MIKEENKWKGENVVYHITIAFFPSEISKNEIREEFEEVNRKIEFFLKNDCYLQKLRKSNKILENDNNSTLATFFHEHIFEVQDLFDFYDETPITEENFPIKSSDLPFEDYLRHFIFWKQLFVQNPIFYEILESFIQYDFLLKNFENESKIKELISSNPILFFLNLFNEKIKLYCELCKAEITENTNDELFLKDLTSKTCSFYRSCIRINEYLENIVVLVQKIHEIENPVDETKITPKFSFFRLMMVNWKEIVISPLEEKCFSIANRIFEDLLFSKTNKNLSKQMESKIHSIFGDNSFSCSESFDTYNTDNSNGFDFLRGYGCYSFEELKLVSAVQLLIDLKLNEFSVMILNTDAEILKNDENYSKFESELVRSVKKFISIAKENKTAIEKIASILLGNKLINCGLLKSTEIKLKSIICKELKKICQENMTISLENFLENLEYEITHHAPTIIFTSNEKEIQDDKSYESYFSVLQEKISNHNFFGFRSDKRGILYSFIKEQKKSDFAVKLFAELDNYLQEAIDEQQYHNKMVGKEIKRRLGENNIEELIRDFEIKGNLKKKNQFFIPNRGFYGNNGGDNDEVVLSRTVSVYT